MILPRISTLSAVTKTFSNWPECVFRAGAAFYLRYFPSAIKWRTRRGTIITSPPGDQSWWAVLETFALDSYGLKKDKFQGDSTPYFVDIGGNIGAFSLAFLEAYPNARGISVEPGSLAFQFLNSNLAANGASSAIETIQAAVVGNQATKTLRFFEKPTATGGSTAVAECTHAEEEPGRWVDVPTVSIADVLSRAGRPITLVKMDIEGGEYEIILNAPAAVWKNVKRIVAEYHPVSGHSYTELVEALGRAGFALEQHDVYKNEGFGALLFVRRDA